MKHTMKMTVILLTLFLIAQFIGIGIIYKYIDPVLSEETGKTTFKELPIGERPPVDETISFIPIIITVLIGTGLLLLLIKYKLNLIWKIWFLLAIVISLTVAWAALMWTWLAALLALVFGIWKVWRPNVLVHTFTELFIYGGLAAIFVPLLNIISVSVLMVLIAIYDAYAVWKSKHMVTLAKSQADANAFAGFMIPYKMGPLRKVKEKSGKKVKKVMVRTAILGGGDVAFPLLFAGVMLKQLGVWQAFVIPFFAALGLGILLYYSEEKKFYPAMPFISGGCFVGLGVIWLIGLLI
jgi:presenilin-like A22 family membrane protease